MPDNLARGKDRRFISDEGFRNAVHAGTLGFKLKVRLTSYRAHIGHLLQGDGEARQFMTDGGKRDPVSGIDKLSIA